MIVFLLVVLWVFCFASWIVGVRWVLASLLFVGVSVMWWPWPPAILVVAGLAMLWSGRGWVR